MNKEYGGYLPLELPKGRGHYYTSKKGTNVLNLNAGRTAFHCAAIDSGMKRIHLPYFTCEETRLPFDELGIEVVEYYIEDDFTPILTGYSQNDYVLWTNYYGNASQKTIERIVQAYPNLIIDNCHAFFSRPVEHAYNCYSARKFFGVNDGAYLIKNSLSSFSQLPIDQSTNYARHLIDQIETGTNSGYLASLENEDRLVGNYKIMSKFTEKILGTVDYEDIKIRRRKNFLIFHETLKYLNDFPVDLTSDTHFYYPFLLEQENLRYKLIEKRVYNPQWWKHVTDKLPKTSIEFRLAKFTILLPLDQRYEPQDIQDICRIVLECVE